uniref:(northern house mosquito) hypothetical protein n=1 Tax=Culex pipiens TaxID=7175 RepID=A0A8D8ALQ3_CULPI
MFTLSFCLLFRALITGGFMLALSSIFSLFLYRLCVLFEGGLHTQSMTYLAIGFVFLRTQRAKLIHIFAFFCLLCVFVCCNNIIPHTFCFVLLLFCVFFNIIYLFL